MEGTPAERRRLLSLDEGSSCSHQEPFQKVDISRLRSPNIPYVGSNRNRKLPAVQINKEGIHIVYSQMYFAPKYIYYLSYTNSPPTLQSLSESLLTYTRNLLNKFNLKNLFKVSATQKTYLHHQHRKMYQRMDPKNTTLPRLKGSGNQNPKNNTIKLLALTSEPRIAVTMTIKILFLPKTMIDPRMQA